MMISFANDCKNIDSSPGLNQIKLNVFILWSWKKLGNKASSMKTGGVCLVCLPAILNSIMEVKLVIVIGIGTLSADLASYCYLAIYFLLYLY